MFNGFISFVLPPGFAAKALRAECEPREDPRVTENMSSGCSGFSLMLPEPANGLIELETGGGG